MIVVATDAPLDARDLKRLAARAVFGLARTGSSYSNGSGDFAIAFSTAAGLRVRFGEQPQARTLLPTDGVSALFQAALEATEEAVYNSTVESDDGNQPGRQRRSNSRRSSDGDASSLPRHSLSNESRCARAYATTGRRTARNRSGSDGIVRASRGDPTTQPGDVCPHATQRSAMRSGSVCNTL